MPRPDTLGLCGRNSTASCQLIWHSGYANKIGVYPSNLLPSKRTVWHAASDGGYAFPPPLIEPGDFGSIGGLFGVTGFGPGQSGVFTPQSHILLSFIKSANRINITHVITQEEIDSADNDISIIDIGEYVLEVIAVTDLPTVITQNLDDEDIVDIEDSGENPDDKLFRKIFDLGIPGSQNRLVGIEDDRISTEYRMDNGSGKINSAFDLAGIGDLNNPNYKDGTSRRLRVDLLKVTTTPAVEEGDPTPPTYPPGSLQAERRVPQAGDTIFITYLAATKHYMRQSVNVAWTIQAADFPIGMCYGFPNDIKVVNYRFYEWQIKDDTWTRQVPVFKRLGGWRAVESFNLPINYIAPIGKFIEVEGGSVRVMKELGDFVMGLDGQTRYMMLKKETNDPSEIPSIKESDLRSFMEGPFSNAEGEYTIQSNADFRGGRYHANSGINNNKNIYKNTAWFTNFTESYLDLLETRTHVFYNVHPLAMHKRDVDKVGIERFLAQAIETDISDGRETSFPFMDDPHVNNPFTSIGTLESLGSANTSFEPIQPIVGYTVANAEIDCAVGGSVRLGSGSFRKVGNADVMGSFVVHSNTINEKFDEGTKVFVERNFTVGQTGKTYLAVQGDQGISGGGVSCLSDPSKFFDFVAHTDEEGFLMMNSFNDGYILKGISELVYRPDLEPVPNEPDLPANQIDDLLNYNGMLGDISGIRPGQRVGVSYFANINSFLFKTTDEDSLPSGVSSDQIFGLNINRSQDDKIIMSLNTGYYGITELVYEYGASDLGDAGAISAVMLFKSSTTIVGSVDSIFIKPTPGVPATLRIDHQWMKGNSIEIIGSGISNVIIHSATITQLKDEKADDFLTGGDTVIEDPNLTSSSVLFKARHVSIGEDINSRLFIFFDDEFDGISCIRSHNFGDAWEYHFGIVEKTQGHEATGSFVVHSPDGNVGFLFFSFLNKIFCKPLDYRLFNYQDSMVVEKFADAISDESPPRERLGAYSEDGRQIRRRLLAWIAAGRVSDESLQFIIGVDPDTGISDPTEIRIIERQNNEGEIFDSEEEVNRSSFAIGGRTVIPNIDIESPFFSVIRTNTGEFRLFFLNTTAESGGGGEQLQCHFSNDDGLSWYDYWKFIENGYGNTEEEASAVYPFGLNLHWSRLAKHKIDQSEFDLHGDSQVIEIESPYVFYDKQSQNLYIFYVYRSCLLCKVVSDRIFSIAAEESERSRNNNSGNKAGGMSKVKESIEQSRSYFIDGDLSSPNTREELHMYINESLSPPQQMTEGNIIFNHQEGIDNFNEERAISAQRVCAYELQHGGIRVLYKHNNNYLKAAILNGDNWIVEDFLKDKDNVDPFETEEIIVSEPVIGGF